MSTNAKIICILLGFIIFNILNMLTSGAEPDFTFNLLLSFISTWIVDSEK